MTLGRGSRSEINRGGFRVCPAMMNLRESLSPAVFLATGRRSTDRNLRRDGSVALSVRKATAGESPIGALRCPGGAAIAEASEHPATIRRTGAGPIR